MPVGKMKEKAMELQRERDEMSGAHLIPEDMEQSIEEIAFENENVAVQVDGLKHWLSNLHVIDEGDAFLRDKDLDTGKKPQGNLPANFYHISVLQSGHLNCIGSLLTLI